MGGLGDYGRYGTIGISWVLATAVYLYLGYIAGEWLDARWGTGPLFLVGGVVLGMVLSLVTLVKEIVALDRLGRPPRDGRQGPPSAPDRERKHFPERDDEAAEPRNGPG